MGSTLSRVMRDHVSRRVLSLGLALCGVAACTPQPEIQALRRGLDVTLNSCEASELVAELRAALHSWVPVELSRLPFTSVLLGSRTDPYCTIERSRLFAHCWGSQFMDYGDCGHINADSGLGSWPEGHVLLQDLMKD